MSFKHHSLILVLVALQIVCGEPSLASYDLFSLEEQGAADPDNGIGLFDEDPIVVMEEKTVASSMKRKSSKKESKKEEPSDTSSLGEEIVSDEPIPESKIKKSSKKSSKKESSEKEAVKEEESPPESKEEVGESSTNVPFDDAPISSNSKKSSKKSSKKGSEEVMDGTTVSPVKHDDEESGNTEKSSKSSKKSSKKGSEANETMAPSGHEVDDEMKNSKSSKSSKKSSKGDSADTSAPASSKKGSKSSKKSSKSASSKKGSYKTSTPSSPDPTKAPSSTVPLVAVSIPTYSIAYQLKQNRIMPSRGELLALTDATEDYMDKYMTYNLWAGLRKFETEFVTSDFQFGQATLVDFSSTVFFEQGSVFGIPTTRALEDILFQALDDVDPYLMQLQNQLSQDNIFYGTIDAEFYTGDDYDWNKKPPTDPPVNSVTEPLSASISLSPFTIEYTFESNTPVPKANAYSELAIVTDVFFSEYMAYENDEHPSTSDRTLMQEALAKFETVMGNSTFGGEPPTALVEYQSAAYFVFNWTAANKTQFETLLVEGFNPAAYLKTLEDELGDSNVFSRTKTVRLLYDDERGREDVVQNSKKSTRPLGIAFAIIAAVGLCIMCLSLFYYGRKQPRKDKDDSTVSGEESQADGESHASCPFTSEV